MVRINTFAPSAKWDVKVDPRNFRRGPRVYATSLYDGRNNSLVRTSESGISISEDGGNTWRNAPLSTLPCTIASRTNEPSAFQIAINPNNPDMVFVGTNCGLARTFDGGATWDYVDPTPGVAGAGNLAERIFSVVAHGDSIIDLIEDNGHFRSANAGNTWSAINNLPAAPGIRNSLSASPAENNVLFATVSGSIFESDNGGQSWPTSITVPAAGSRIAFAKTNQSITSNQFDLWYGGTQIFKTTGTTSIGGSSSRVPANPVWTKEHTGSHDDVGDILFDPQASAGACPILFSNDGGVYRNLIRTSPACETPLWEQPNVTPHATWLFGFDGVQQSPGIHGIYYGLQDNGEWGTINAVEGPAGAVPEWNNVACCDGTTQGSQSNLIVYIRGFFSPGRSFKLFKSGSNFSSGENEIPNYPSTGSFGAFKDGRELVRFGNNAYAITLSDGVYTTNNINASPIAWRSLNAPSGSTVGNQGHLKVSTVGGPTSIYYHTGSGNPNSQGQIFRRGINSDDSWIPLPLPSTVGSVTIYDVDPNNGNNLIICGINNGSGGITANNFSMWSTTNFGLNWTPMPNLDNLMTGSGTFVNVTTEGPTNFTGFSSYWQPSMVQINPLNGNTVVAGAEDAGVFLSTNFGNSWQLMSNPTNPTSNSPHIPRPLFAYFTPVRFTPNSSSFDVWIGTQGAGVRKILVESP